MARTPTAPPDRVKPPERGFTLVELVTTLAILAITLALAAPALNDLRQRQQAIATGNLLVTHLNLARHHAVTRRVPTLACPSHDLQTCRPGSDWSGGWIVFSDRDGNRRPDRADDILWAERIPRQRDIRITTSANRSKVRYNADGRSSGSNLTFTVCTRRGLLNQIIINNAGRVRLGRSASATACA